MRTRNFTIHRNVCSRHSRFFPDSRGNPKHTGFRQSPRFRQFI
jgi:hypothetical protein